MKSIFVHIGMHKTGSSSIQKTLADFDNGAVRYAQLGDSNQSVALYSIFSQNRFLRRHFKRKGLSVSEMRDIVAKHDANLQRELNRDFRTLIFSAEDLSLLKDQDDVRALKDRLSRHAEEVTVLAYVRDPSGFGSSSFQQKVRVGFAQPEIPDVAYRARFEPFLKVFGPSNVHLRRFAPPLFPNESVTLDFMDQVGIGHSAVSEKTANTSLSAPATRLLFQFNASGPVAHGNPMVFDLRKRLTISIRRATGEGKFVFPPELIAAKAGLADDIAWLRDHAGIDFPIPEGEVLPEQELRARIQKLLEVTPEDTELLQIYCKKKKIRVPKGASAQVIMSLMFYHEFYLQGCKDGAVA